MGASSFMYPSTTSTTTTTTTTTTTAPHRMGGCHRSGDASRCSLNATPIIRDDTTSQIIEPLSNSFPSSKSSNGVVEIWLDLRGTSITPKTALELWELDEQMQQQSNSNKARKETKPPFMRCLVSSISKQSDSSSLVTPPANNPLDVLMVGQEEAGGMRIITQTQKSSSSFGSMISLQPSPASASIPILPDPLPLIDLASQGLNVLLDTKGWKKVAEEKRLSMLLPLIELITSSTATNADGGIVGWTCFSNSEIVETAMWIQSMGNGSKGSRGGNTLRTKTLDSGILIPDLDDIESFALDSTVIDEDSTEQKRDECKFAIIVPYDVALLRAAMMLLGDSSYDMADHDGLV